MYIAHNTSKTLNLDLERENLLKISFNATFKFQISPIQLINFSLASAPTLPIPSVIMSRVFPMH